VYHNALKCYQTRKPARTSHNNFEIAATLVQHQQAVPLFFSSIHTLLSPPFPSMMPPSARSMIPLMDESGQTDEERRRLRQKQRNLQKTIESQTEAMEDVSSEVFGKVREENNDLFRQVFYTREAVLDGDNLNMISERAAKQVEGLVQVSYSVSGVSGALHGLMHARERGSLCLSRGSVVCCVLIVILTLTLHVSCSLP
jgi:hypothetical protein